MSLGSMFHAVEGFFKKVFGSTTWEKTASTTLGLIAPLTEEIVSLAAGEPAAAEVQSVVTQVQSDLATVAGVVGGVSPSPSLIATATNALNSVKTNLGSLLTAGHIKNATTLTKVTGIVNTIIGEVDAILDAVSSPSAPTPATT